MAKDPAFLFYDGDAARDVSHMNRIERGAYFDFIQAQRKFRGITIEQVRKILGRDFEDCWPALEMILSVDQDGKYFIDWIRESGQKRAEHAEIQRKRIQEYWDKRNKKEESKVVPSLFRGITNEVPFENAIVNENENENENKKGIVKGKQKKEFVPPTLNEWREFWKTEGFSDEIAIQAFKSYEGNNWKDSKEDQVRNWKMKCRQVWFKPNNKIKNENNQRNPSRIEPSGTVAKGGFGNL